jgi:hypothetical protein
VLPAAPPTPDPAARARRVLEWILSGLFGLLLALPLLQSTTGYPPDIRLFGAEVTEPEPVFTWKAWFNGDFPAAVERWTVGKVGLRGYLVRLASQANYSLFGRLGVNPNSTVVEGRDHWLFEEGYITEAASPRKFPRKRAVEIAGQAARLQQALARKGIAFAVVIAPSKAEIYPEYLPAGTPKADPGQKTAYARLISEFRKHNVPLVDGRELFLSLKGTERDLFPKGGIHWSYHAAWLTWQKLVELLRAQAPCADLPLQTIERLAWHQPLGSDADLSQLLNLWHFEPGGPAPLPYPLVAAPPAEARRRYAAMVVGDSFARTLIDAMARSLSFRKIELLYYFKRRYTYDPHASDFKEADGKLIAKNGKDAGALDKSRIPWADLLNNRQMVLLALSEINIREGGWGFLESILAAVEAEAPDLAGNPETGGSGKTNRATLTANLPE